MNAAPVMLEHSQKRTLQRLCSGVCRDTGVSSFQQGGIWGHVSGALQRVLLTVSAIRVKIVLFSSHSHIFLVN